LEISCEDSYTNIDVNGDREHLKKNIAILTAVLFLLLVTSVTAGMVVEYKALKTIDGNIIEAETLKNSLVILSIMAQWCPSCRAEAHVLQKSYIENKDKGVLFVGLFVKSTDKGIRKFADRNGVTFPVVNDNGMARQFDVWSIPMTLLIEKNGKIKRRYIGRINEDVLRKGIEEIQNQNKS
jgi:peroxiredoxin